MKLWGLIKDSLVFFAMSVVFALLQTIIWIKWVKSDNPDDWKTELFVCRTKNGEHDDCFLEGIFEPNQAQQCEEIKNTFEQKGIVAWCQKTK